MDTNGDISPAKSERIGVLFVCLGNICRSPLAAGVFLHHARLRGVAHRFDVDSCGTGGWHAGAAPDPRSVAVAALRSITLDHRARQLDARRDFARFHHILAMDRSNLRDIAAAGETLGVAHARVRLLRSFDPNAGCHENGEIPDPYYGGQDGFERVFSMIDSSCAALLENILPRV